MTGSTGSGALLVVLVDDRPRPLPVFGIRDAHTIVVRAEADDRSMAPWIRAVEHVLKRAA